MARFCLIALLACAALLAALMPWVSPAGSARLWAFVTLPAIATGTLLLLAKRRGARGWLLAALLWTAAFPFALIFATPDRLLAVMAAQTGKSNATFLWNTSGLAAGKLVSTSAPPDLGNTPGTLIAGSLEWLRPPFWLAVFALAALWLTALAHPRRGWRGWEISGQLAANAALCALAAVLILALVRTRQWQTCLATLSSPASTPAALLDARRFVDAYPPALLNPAFRTLLLNATPIDDPRLRTELALVSKDWPLANAHLLLANLPALATPTPPRLGSLRLIWWSPTLRDWIRKASNNAELNLTGRLLTLIDSADNTRMWTFIADYRTGRWEHAAAQGEILAADPTLYRYQSSTLNLLGTLYSRLEHPEKAREAWLTSFELDPTNNDSAIRGLGALGP